MAVKVIAKNADWARSTAIIVQPQLAHAKPADLAGKTLVAPDIPVLRMFWINWCKRNGISPRASNGCNAAPSDLLVAFLSKRADILLMWAPAINKAMEAGGVKWQDGKNSYRPGAEGPAPVYYNWGVTFAPVAWYDKHPHTVEAFLSGLYMAQAYMKCHADEVVQIVAKEAKLDPEARQDPDVAERLRRRHGWRLRQGRCRARPTSTLRSACSRRPRRRQDDRRDHDREGDARR